MRAHAAGWLGALRHPEGEVQLDDSWRAFMAERRARIEKARLQKRNEQRREQRQQKHQQQRQQILAWVAACEAAGPVQEPPRKRGRPVDPTSQRQRQLAMTPAERAREREERKAAQRARPDKRFQAADLTLRHLTRRFVDVCYNQLLDVMRSYPDRVAARVEAAWRCALRVGEQTLRSELSHAKKGGRK